MVRSFRQEVGWDSREASARASSWEGVGCFGWGSREGMERVVSLPHRMLRLVGAPLSLSFLLLSFDRGRFLSLLTMSTGAEGVGDVERALSRW